MNWLISLSGVDRELLARSPGERAKYMGVGGAILTTAVMAAASATYALYVSMKPPIVVAVLIGALWGLGILNLDRWIVASTKRQGAFFKDIAMVLPRLLLALIIGAVISEPLVLRIFQREIDAELQIMQSEDQAKFESDWLKDPRYKQLQENKAQQATLQDELANGVPADAVIKDPTVADLTQRLSDVEKQLAAAEKQVACEGTGGCGSGTAGAGPVFKQNVAARDRLAREDASLTAQLNAAEAAARTKATAAFKATRAAKQRDLDALTTSITVAESARARDVAVNTSRVHASDGLLARIEALNRLTSTHPAMSEARTFLFLFILAIEIMPALVKLFMNLAKPGLYEQLQQAEEDAEKERALLRIRVEAEEGHMAAQVALDAAEAKARAELDAHVAVARALLDAQVKLGKAAAAKWRTEKLELLRDEPQTFFGTVDIPRQPVSSPVAVVPSVSKRSRSSQPPVGPKKVSLVKKPRVVRVSA